MPPRSPASARGAALTVGERNHAIVEILTAVQRGAPADAAIGAHFRHLRLSTESDRAAVATGVYDVLRSWARRHWWLARRGETPSPGNLARLKLPPDPADMPEAVRLECPDWAEPGLRAVFGDRFGKEMAALNRDAALELRVNGLLAAREDVQAELAKQDIAARPTPLSPWGLAVKDRPPLAQTAAFKAGRFDIQDEGAQLIALLTDARPGMQVVDFCAGAGGKTLALAARMQNKGHLTACDIGAKKLERAGQRFRRAGIGNAERRLLSGTRDDWIKKHKARFDRVLVDAPCTGSGSWRRNPDAKWSRSAADLGQLAVRQADILAAAAKLVKPGGRLVYSTCSLLPAENEDIVSAFLAHEAGFRLLPIAAVWAETLAAPCPAQTDMLRLTPARNGTDGFFVAVMERTKE